VYIYFKELNFLLYLMQEFGSVERVLEARSELYEKKAEKKRRKIGKRENDRRIIWR